MVGFAPVLLHYMCSLYAVFGVVDSLQVRGWWKQHVFSTLLHVFHVPVMKTRVKVVPTLVYQFLHNCVPHRDKCLQK